MNQAVAVADRIGFPIMIRAGFALGGQKSGVVRTVRELEAKVAEALAFSPQVLIEKYLHHFKEIEYEIVRDQDDNCVAVCNMENMDPLGIHTGESIVVAPSQTLTNFEDHFLRSRAIELVRSLNIIGECNVQFALNPNPKGDSTIDYYIIELNPRLSRSSALASKATGYPLAYVATKLILGKSLTEVKNQVTKVTQSAFEPALDYLVVKIPRWDLDKFRKVEQVIGSSMKSVGEVMAIGRNFEETIQKAIRMLDIGQEGVTDFEFSSKKDIVDYLKVPTPKRIFAIAESLRSGLSVDEIYRITGIDPWFLHRIKNIVDGERNIIGRSSKILDDADSLLHLKQLGFSDKRIGVLVGKKGLEIREHRKKLRIKPSVFQIDTLAGEFPAQTNYLYMTYGGSHNDVVALGKGSVIVLGSGPYRIGSSVEFDWSCVHASSHLKKYNKKSVVVNCNPETVSTDYDMSERLYFEELSFERVTDIYEFENPDGVVVSVGGQRPNNLAKSLSKNGLKIYGTNADDIDRAENRNAFSKLCDDLSIAQPYWTEAATAAQAIKFADKIGYPVLIRPSYVLSGSAMRVCFSERDLKKYIGRAVVVNKKYPVTVSKFFLNAKEIELDGVAQDGEVKVYGVAEHVEHAGVHSGDATIVYPPEQMYLRTEKKVIDIAKKLARGLKITGPFNIQFLAKKNKVYVIEINLRASRSFPFMSKSTGINFAEVAVDSFFGKAKHYEVEYPEYSVVKSPQFSFARLEGADPVTGVEMASTGEVACFGENYHLALIKSVYAAGVSIREKTVLLTIGGIVNKKRFLESARLLKEQGFKLFSTKNTHEFLSKNGVRSKLVNKVYEHKKPNVVDTISTKKVSLVINVSDMLEESRNIENLTTDDYLIRRATVDANIPLFTDLKLAISFIDAISRYGFDDLDIKSWREYK